MDTLSRDGAHAGGTIVGCSMMWQGARSSQCHPILPFA